MDLFKARQAAHREYDEIEQRLAIEPTHLKRKLGGRVHHALYYPKHKLAGTAANLLAEKT